MDSGASAENPALHARPWNKFRFLIDSSFLPLYMKRGAGGVPRRWRWRQHHPSASRGGATIRQGVRLGGRTFASVALALLAFTADALPSAAAELPTDPKCEFIASPGSSKCMLPFPDEYYTKADPTSPTGRRIDFRELAMPTNAAGAPIEAAPYNVGDGFSPGSASTPKVPRTGPSADAAATVAAPSTAIGRSAPATAPGLLG